jgi:hypothetical protein
VSEKFGCKSVDDNADGPSNDLSYGERTGKRDKFKYF